jgi:hypothetical protein
VCESCQCQEDYFGEYCQPRYDKAVSVAIRYTKCTVAISKT